LQDRRRQIVQKEKNKLETGLNGVKAGILEKFLVDILERKEHGRRKEEIHRCNWKPFQTQDFASVMDIPKSSFD